jgi:hypothetical protein
MSAADHWETVKRTLSLKASADRKDDGELDRAETSILKEEARTPADVIAKLKVALLHMSTDGWVDIALAADDHETLLARESELDFPERLIAGAIHSLREMAHG